MSPDRIMNMSVLRLFPCLLVALLGACSVPAKVGLPSSRTLEAGHEEFVMLAELPPPEVYVQPGDMLRIVRDAQTPAQQDEMTLFVVRPDGNISIPFIGKMNVGGRTPDEIAQDITTRFRAIYIQPEVTVNIAEAPGNRVFVGGEVRNPSVYPLDGLPSIEQSLIAAGGVLPTADSENIALLRLARNGKYNLYFFNYAQLLMAEARNPVMLQRGDIVFVPKSTIGNMVEAIDMYFTRLFPINKGIGFGFNYDMNRKGSSTVYYPASFGP